MKIYESLPTQDFFCNLAVWKHLFAYFEKMVSHCKGEVMFRDEVTEQSFTCDNIVVTLFEHKVVYRALFTSLIRSLMKIRSSSFFTLFIPV